MNPPNHIFNVGDPVPYFTCHASNNPTFNFDTVAGRYIVLTFFGTASAPKNANSLNYINSDLRRYFDDQNIAFFGVTIDPEDQQLSRVVQMLPGIRYFWDFDRKISRLYGAITKEEITTALASYTPFTLLLDPNLRVLANIPLSDADKHNQILEKCLSTLPPLNNYAGMPIHAPILIIPRIFEPSFCNYLIDLYQTNGGYESGFMIEKNGQTVGVINYSFKRRSDYNLELEPNQKEVCAIIQHKIVTQVVPEIYKAFNYKVTRMERYLIACYDGDLGGYFKPHRDNTTKATAHRCFACTINLNAEEYEGGNLRFPEYGEQTYRAPTGGAIVFSGSLLHEVTPVIGGKRYAFLPFLYDELAAQIRRNNQQFLSEEVIKISS